MLFIGGRRQLFSCMRGMAFLLCLALPLLFVSCGNLAKGKKEAGKSVHEFHVSFNEQKFNDIYDLASAEFRKATTKLKFEEFLGVVFRKLGKVIDTKNQNWKVQNFNLMTQVILLQETSFEQGKAIETFTYVMKDGKAVLQGYNINSNDLIMK